MSLCSPRDRGGRSGSLARKRLLLHLPICGARTWRGEASVSERGHRFARALSWCDSHGVGVPASFPSSEMRLFDSFSIAEKISWCSQKMETRSTDWSCSLPSPLHGQNEQTSKEFQEHVYHLQGPTPRSGVSRRHQSTSQHCSRSRPPDARAEQQGPPQQGLCFGVSTLPPPSLNHLCGPTTTGLGALGIQAASATSRTPLP